MYLATDVILRKKLKVDILGVDILGVDILGVDILGVDILGVDILGVDILRLTLGHWCNSVVETLNTISHTHLLPG